LALPWTIVTCYTLNFFYCSGKATLLDSGWFVYLYTHGSGLALQNPITIRHGSFYAFHMSPLIAILRLLHGVVWNGYDSAWFSLTQGFWYGVTGFGAWLAMRKAAPHLALAASLLTALGGVELATIGFPHYEVAIPALLILFLVVFRDADRPWALLILPVLLSVREDAGLHAAGIFLLIGCYFAVRHEASARRATWAYFILAGLSFTAALLSLAIQHAVFADGYEALGHTYLGQPRFSHVNFAFLIRRLANLGVYRAYIFLPVALILFAAVRLRNPLMIVGPLACGPWLLLSLLAVSQQAGLLCNYYAFPFMIALAWPAVCLALRHSVDGRLAWLQIAASVISIALFPLAKWNDDLSPWAHVLPPAWSDMRRTEAVLDSVLAAQSGLGAWVADDAAASLRLGAFDERHVAVGFRHAPMTMVQTDTLFGAASPPSWLAERQGRMVEASRLVNVYRACGTMLALHTRLELQDARLLEIFRQLREDASGRVDGCGSRYAGKAQPP
jgi:hypothetical protein